MANCYEDLILHLDLSNLFAKCSQTHFGNPCSVVKTNGALDRSFPSADLI